MQKCYPSRLTYLMFIIVLHLMTVTVDVISHFQDTISYAITGASDSSVALSFFYIDNTRGVIYLRRPLTETTVRQFTVSYLSPGCNGSVYVCVCVCVCVYVCVCVCVCVCMCVCVCVC